MRVKRTHQDAVVPQPLADPVSGGSDGPSMAAPPRALEHSKSHPRMLRSNATSHVWPFGALAELVDNAQDSEAQAKTVSIRGENSSREGSLVIEDDGMGMTRPRLHCMLSFGFSNKEHVAGNVGRFGIGFKSGSMRLGDDVIVLTREEATVSFALLSQTFLIAEQADDILIPMLTWRIGDDGALEPILPASSEDWEWSVRVITKYSIYRSEAAMMEYVKSRRSHGTIITIFNLKKPFEFMFKNDDIILHADPGDAETGKQKHFHQERDGQQASLVVEEDHSLRKYLEILYLEPKVTIFLQGRQVKFRNPLDFLEIQRMEFGPYAPKLPNVSGEIKCWFGYNSSSGKLCGTHIYHKNRLIRMYQRFGSQLQNNCMMKDMLGVAVADCLTPTHNKQDFDTSSIVYGRFKAFVVKKMNEYYFTHQTHRDAGKNGRVREKQAKKKAQQLSRDLAAISSDEDATELEYIEIGGDDDDEDEGSASRARKRPRPQSAPNTGGGSVEEQWLRICRTEWKKISGHRFAPPFKQPVDVEVWGCTDYYDIIDHPMDLSTISKKLNQQDYSSPLDFEKDMLQMFRNAVIYNGENHVIGKYAIRLEELFRRSWTKAKERIPCEAFSVLKSAEAHAEAPVDVEIVAEEVQAEASRSVEIVTEEVQAEAPGSAEIAAAEAQDEAAGSAEPVAEEAQAEAAGGAGLAIPDDAKAEGTAPVLPGPSPSGEQPPCAGQGPKPKEPVVAAGPNAMECDGETCKTASREAATAPAKRKQTTKRQMRRFGTPDSESDSDDGLLESAEQETSSRGGCLSRPRSPKESHVPLAMDKAVQTADCFGFSSIAQTQPGEETADATRCTSSGSLKDPQAQQAQLKDLKKKYAELKQKNAQLEKMLETLREKVRRGE